MAVANPFYRRIAGVHPDRDAQGNQRRPKIPVEVILGLMWDRRTGVIASDAALSALISEASNYQDGATGNYTPVGLDATELAQFNDLLATVTTGNASAARAERLHKIRITLNMLEFSGLDLGVNPPVPKDNLTGYGPDDMAGTTSVAGGKLGVIRRDSP